MLKLRAGRDGLHRVREVAHIEGPGTLPAKETRFGVGGTGVLPWATYSGGGDAVPTADARCMASSETGRRLEEAPARG